MTQTLGQAVLEALDVAGRGYDFPSSGFLFQDRESLEQVPNILAMDGRLSLQEFFRLAPAPRSRSEGILISYRCRGIVPDSWKSATRFFRHFTYERTKAISSLVLCGVIRVEKSSRFRRALETAKRVAAKTLPGVQPTFSFRFTSLEERPKTSPLGAIAALFETFGEDIEVDLPDQLLARDNYSGSAFLDLTDFSLCTASHLTHHLLSSGATPLLPSYQGIFPRKTKGIHVPLSRYHGVELLGDASSIVSEWRRRYPMIRALEFSRSSQNSAALYLGVTRTS